jgi:hypothetical protein
MERSMRAFIHSCLCALAVVGAPQRGRAGADSAEFVVAVSADNPVAELTRAELRRLFSGGTKQWSAGAVVQVALVPSPVPETAALAGWLDTTPSELISRIQQQVFRGEMRRPVVLRSAAQCTSFVAQTPGGICVSARAAAGAKVAGARFVALK